MGVFVADRLDERSSLSTVVVGGGAGDSSNNINNNNSNNNNDNNDNNNNNNNDNNNVDDGAGDESFAPLNFARADDVKFTPFVSLLCESVPEEAQHSQQEANDRASASLYISEPSVDGLQRPIITARSVSEFEGGYHAFVAFLRRFREQANVSRLSGQAADLQFIEAMFKRDFSEA